MQNVSNLVYMYGSHMFTYEWLKVSFKNQNPNFREATLTLMHLQVPVSII